MKQGKTADIERRSVWEEFERALSEERIEKFVVSWTVEWRTVQQPDEWALFSTPTTDPRDAQSSYDMATKNPVCVAARFVERLQLNREIPAEELKKRRKTQSKAELRLPIQAEGFGRPPTVALK